MAPTKRRRGTALVEIVHGGERGVLVVSDGDHWMLPGGGADRPHETRFEAAIRELYEETSLRATAAVTLFDHETSNQHRVCYMRATGTPKITDPSEVRALGLCRSDMSIIPIDIASGATVGPTVTPGTRAILERFATYRAERPTFFAAFERYEHPERGDGNREPNDRRATSMIPSQASQILPGTASPPPAFQLLDSLTITTSGGPRTIAIYQGDLTAIPPKEAVDVLVVSALPDSYRPSRQSLIGALDRRGVSLEALATDKAEDFRPTLACWLSKPIEAAGPAVQFQRILCFEPKQRGEPAEVIGDIFQCLVSMSSKTPINSIAMPILGGGVHGVSTVEMIAPLFEAATHWFHAGLPIETIKVVAYSDISAAELRGAFGVLKRLYTPPVTAPTTSYKYDLFISYCHANKDEVDVLVAELKRQQTDIRIFQDTLVLKPGTAWQQEILESLDSCAKIVTLYTPQYLASAICLEEYGIALIRNRREGRKVLAPIYLRTCTLPTYMELVQYIDCREGDHALIIKAAGEILSKF